jgi:nucleoside-triphosphatase THEP1
MVQTGQCADSSLSAVLLHNQEKLLLAQDFDPAATGCRLDLDRLQAAGARVSDALAAGADLVIVNRFGKRERDGGGLVSVIERARKAEVPVVIAVSRERIVDWIKFGGATSVKLACERQALDAWWHDIAPRTAGPRS